MTRRCKLFGTLLKKNHTVGILRGFAVGNVVCRFSGEIAFRAGAGRLNVACMGDAERQTCACGTGAHFLSEGGE